MAIDSETSFLWFSAPRSKTSLPETLNPDLSKFPIDPQDPLPESNWLYRRLVLIGTLVWLLAQRSWEEYYHIFNRWTDILMITILILYTVAPSAEQVSKMLATVSLFGPGSRYRDIIKEFQTDHHHDDDHHNYTEPAPVPDSSPGVSVSSIPDTKPSEVPPKVVPQSDDVSDKKDETDNEGVIPPELRVKRR